MARSYGIDLLSLTALPLGNVLQQLGISFEYFRAFRAFRVFRGQWVVKRLSRRFSIRAEQIVFLQTMIQPFLQEIIQPPFVIHDFTA